MPVPYVVIAFSEPTACTSSECFSASVITSSGFVPLGSASLFALPSLSFVVFLISFIAIFLASFLAFYGSLGNDIVFVVPVYAATSFLFLSARAAMPS